MRSIIDADEKVHLGHFYDSPRHRMQVDFRTDVADLMKELEAGAARANAAAADGAKFAEGDPDVDDQHPSTYLTPSSEWLLAARARISYMLQDVTVSAACCSATPT